MGTKTSQIIALTFIALFSHQSKAFDPNASKTTDRVNHDTERMRLEKEIAELERSYSDGKTRYQDQMQAFIVMAMHLTNPPTLSSMLAPISKGLHWTQEAIAMDKSLLEKAESPLASSKDNSTLEKVE